MLSPQEEPNLWQPTMPRYSMETTRTRHRHGRDIDFTYKNRSIGYDTTRYVAHFEVSVHHRWQPLIKNRALQGSVTGSQFKVQPTIKMDLVDGAR